MESIESLLVALDERTVARLVGIPHDEARMSYALRSNTVRNFSEFEDVISSYFNHHHTRCNARGGLFSPSQSRSRAKDIVEREYRRQNGNLNTAFYDAADGTNGGLRHVLDVIAENLKAEAVDAYVRDAFDRHVSPVSWPEKVQIMLQFLVRHGAMLSPGLRGEPPERFASNYEELIRAYVEGLQRTSRVFRST